MEQVLSNLQMIGNIFQGKKGKSVKFVLNYISLMWNCSMTCKD